MKVTQADKLRAKEKVLTEKLENERRKLAKKLDRAEKLLDYLSRLGTDAQRRRYVRRKFTNSEKALINNPRFSAVLAKLIKAI